MPKTESANQSTEHTRQVPELTLKAVVLGALLSALLAAANAYLGLFAGMTVSASIPAAVLSMGVFRVFGGSILENNLVQTAASAGESAAAGAIFTLPALVILGAWADFDYWLTMLLTLLGGVLGVLFTILLRPSLVVEGDLAFPEGRATAEVLKAGHSQSESMEAGSPHANSSRGLKLLMAGGIFGAIAKLMESALGWSKATVEGAWALGGSGGGPLFYWGMGVSPALTAVGFIVGLDIALVVFLGGCVNWLCFLPFVALPDPNMSELQVVWETWSTKTRYLGVGAMTVGGIYTLWEVRSSIYQAVSAAFRALRGGSGHHLKDEAEIILRNRDLPARGVLLGGAFALVPLFGVFYYILGESMVALILAVLVMVFGFLFSAVAAYMAGLVGSSNNPVSGVTIATILFTSLLLAWWGVKAVAPGFSAAAGPAAAILVGSVVCTAAAIGGDNMQDLKAGHILGATPYRQQIMQLVGVVVAALVLGPTLQLLLDAYGFGPSTLEHPHALRAPQATLMASVADGVFGGRLPWTFFTIGCLLGVGVIGLDLLLQRRVTPFRIPVLAFALGLYLPWEISFPVLFGGICRRVVRSREHEGRGPPWGILMGAGLITGEALMGIFLAGMVAFGSKLEWLRTALTWQSTFLSFVIVLGALLLLFFSTTERQSKRKSS